MATLNIHRGDGSLFERLDVKLDDLSSDGIARMFHVSLLRDRHFYAVLVSKDKPIAMIYSGEGKDIVRIVFCDNHTNQEFNMG